MKSLRWHGAKDIRIEEVEDPPSPAGDEIQLQVLCCGICGTDVEEWLNGPYLMTNAPIVMGHEISGTVIKVGENVSGFKLGDRVGVDGLSGCGLCSYCANDRVNLCEKLSAVGFMSSGGLAEYVNIKADVCLKIPENAPDEAGALAETLSVAIRALKRARFAPHESVSIIGAGAVGLLTAQAARAMGSQNIKIYETNKQKSDLARKLGFKFVYDPSEFSFEKNQTDVSIECSGSASGVNLSIKCIKSSGRVVLLGISKEKINVDTFDLITKEKEIIGSLSHIKNSDFKDALDMIAQNKVRIQEIISHKIPLSRVIEDGFNKINAKDESIIKILVYPNYS